MEFLSQLTAQNKEMLLFLTKNNKDEIKYFYEYYWEGPDKQFFALANYRGYKLEQDQVTYTEFEAEFNINKQAALERLFKHKVVLSDIDELDSLLKSGISLFDVYQEHMQNRKLHLLRIINIIVARSKSDVVSV